MKFEEPVKSTLYEQRGPGSVYSQLLYRHALVRCQSIELATGEDRMVLVIAQRKTKVENTIRLHPVAKAILDKRRGRVALDADDGYIFRLPSQEGALKCLDT